MAGLDMGEESFTCELLDDHKKDGSAPLLYGNALLTFLEEGATNTSRARLRKAFKAGPFVPVLLLLPSGARCGLGRRRRGGGLHALPVAHVELRLHRRDPVFPDLLLGRVQSRGGDRRLGLL